MRDTNNHGKYSQGGMRVRNGCASAWYAKQTLTERHRQCRPEEVAAYLLIVVQDDNHVLVQEACMVHGFVGHTTCDGSISDDCYTVVLATLQVQQQPPFYRLTLSTAMANLLSTDQHCQLQWATSF